MFRELKLPPHSKLISSNFLCDVYVYHYLSKIAKLFCPFCWKKCYNHKFYFSFNVWYCFWPDMIFSWLISPPWIGIVFKSAGKCGSLWDNECFLGQDALAKSASLLFWAALGILSRCGRNLHTRRNNVNWTCLFWVLEYFCASNTMKKICRRNWKISGKTFWMSSVSPILSIGMEKTNQILSQFSRRALSIDLNTAWTNPWTLVSKRNKKSTKIGTPFLEETFLLSVFRQVAGLTPQRRYHRFRFACPTNGNSKEDNRKNSRGKLTDRFHRALQANYS